MSTPIKYNTEEERRKARNAANKRCYSLHAEQRRAYMKKYSKEHPDRVREACKKWYASHSEQKKNASKKYYAGNAEKIKESTRKSYSENRAKEMINDIDANNAVLDVAIEESSCTRKKEMLARLKEANEAKKKKLQEDFGL